MMPRRWAWGSFTVCALLLLGATYWLNRVILRLEHNRIAVQAGTDYQAALRLALWRMDARLAPLLAREASRPYYEYRSFYPRHRPDTAFLEPTARTSDWEPSPLLGPGEPPVRLHFQLNPNGTVTSPEIPAGRRTLPEGVTRADLRSRERTLRRLDRVIDAERFRQAVTDAEVSVVVHLVEPAPTPEAPATNPMERSREEYAIRARQIARSLAQTGTSGPVTTGPMAPMWLVDPASHEPALVFVRRVALRGVEFVQGTLVDWDALQEELLADVDDLFSEAQLVPVVEPEAQYRVGDRRLASVPAALEVTWMSPPVGDVVTPMRIALFVVWLLVGGAIVVGGIAMRSQLGTPPPRSNEDDWNAHA